MKRCHFYDNQGNPRTRPHGKPGCPRGKACLYIHPGDYKWDTLDPVPPPPPYIATDAPKSGRSRSTSRSVSDINDRERDRRMSGSTHSPTRYDATIYRRSPQPYSSEHRQRSTSPTRSFFHDERNRYSKHSEFSYRQSVDYDRRDTNERNYRDDTSGRYRDDRSYASNRRPSVTLDARDSSVHAYIPQPHSSSNVLLPPPPPPSAPPPGPAPPPPLPPPPAFLSDAPPKVGEEATKKPLTDDEKRAVWSQRLKLMGEFVNLSLERSTLEAELQNFQRITQSWRYDGVGDEAKSNMSVRLTQIEAQGEEKNKELHAIITRLMETDFWPILRQPNLQDIEAKYKDMRAVVGELKDTVTEMNTSLHSVVSERIGGSRGTSVPSSRSKQPEAMDIDPQGDSEPRPYKRRRLSVGGDDRETQEDAPSFHLSPNVRDEMQDRFTVFERKLSDLENQITQHDRDLMEEVDGRIETKFEQMASLPSQPPGGSESGTTNDLPSGKAQEVEHTIQFTGEQLGELAEEVGSIFIRTTTAEADIARLEQENEQMRQYFAEEMEKCRAIFERDQVEIKAMSAALAAHLARPPSPSPIPHMPPVEAIIEVIEEPLLESVQAQLQPLIEELRSNLSDLLQTKNSEMYQTLWSKLSLVSRMMEAISVRLHEDGSVSQDTSNGQT